MTVYQLSNGLTFSKTIVQSGEGLHAPNEGSTCRVIVKFLCHSEEPLNENLYADLLPLNEEKAVELGFYSSIIASYLHKCLITMKRNEICQLIFNDPNISQPMEISIHLLSFERFVEIYSMTLKDLWQFATKHKENANHLFQEKFYCQAFELYHRSLCYILNLSNEEPAEEHQPYLDRSNQLVLSIYSNMAACQLICGNYSGVIENCSSALQIDSNFVKALFRRASAYAQLNDYELALIDLQLAQKIEPNDKKIDQLFKETKSRFEQYKKTLGNSLKNLF